MYYVPDSTPWELFRLPAAAGSTCPDHTRAPSAHFYTDGNQQRLFESGHARLYNITYQIKHNQPSSGWALNSIRSTRTNCFLYWITFLSPDSWWEVFNVSTYVRSLIFSVPSVSLSCALNASSLFTEGDLQQVLLGSFMLSHCTSISSDGVMTWHHVHFDVYSNLKIFTVFSLGTSRSAGYAVLPDGSRVSDRGPTTNRSKGH